MARLFTAVELAPDVRAAIVRCQSDLGSTVQRSGSSSLRMVGPSALHLSLLFLGEVPDAQVGSVMDAVGQGFAVAPFDVEIGTCGVFPPRGHARVLWLGLMQGTAPLMRLFDRVSDRLASIGLERSTGRFTPHVTIGRWRGTGLPRARLALPPVASVAVQHVASVSLLRSQLLPGGAVHTRLIDGALGGLADAGH
jgi:2'-5' RNA ligase